MDEVYGEEQLERFTAPDARVGTYAFEVFSYTLPRFRFTPEEQAQTTLKAFHNS